MMRMKGVRNMNKTSKTFSKNVIAIGLALMMVAGSIIAVGASASAATKVAKDPTAATRVSKKDEYYIFKLSPKVNRQHVYYRNRFGIELAGDLYTAKNLDKNQKHPALVIGPPFGGVKEQGPGVYANQLAQRGFVVLTFDPSYHGYSGGQPRYNGSAAVYAEDFSAGVDFLGMQKFVDRDKIGAIGICGSGGFALDAASMDTRIKAVATSVMYDIAGENAHSLQYSKDAYARLKDPKELYIVKGANHVDLYDDVSKIPFDKLVSFFNNAFRQ